MVSLCLEMGKKEEALDYVEKAKSRALVDLLSQKLNFKGNDEKFLKKVRKLKEDLNWWYSKAEQRAGGEGKRGEGLKIFQAIRSRERRLQRLIQAQEITTPQRKDSLWPVKTEGISFHEIRDLLDGKQMLLEYYPRLCTKLGKC